MTTQVATSTWQINTTGSRLEFAVKQRILGILGMTVRGRFVDVQGTVTIDERVPENSSVEAVIRSASIDTGISGRDRHLRSADFFDVERYPQISFQSRSVEPIDATAGRYRVIGSLTVKGISREVVLELSADPEQNVNQRDLHFVATTTVSRRDFGLDFSSPFARNVDAVEVTLDIEAIAA